jgi:hypothetical protein
MFSLDEFRVLPSHYGKSKCGVGLSSVLITTIGYEKRFNQSVDVLSDKQKFLDYMKNQKHWKCRNILELRKPTWATKIRKFL